MRDSSSPNLARMIAASRRLQGPSDSDRARVGSAIERRLVVGATAATVAGTGKAIAGTAGKASLFGALASSGAAKLIVASAMVAGGGVAAWRLVASTAPVPVPRTTTSTTSRNAVAETRPVAPIATSSTATVPPPEQAVPASRPVHTASTTGSAPSASMSRELTLVRSAQRALESGDARGALAVLDRYQKEFPSGMLAQEAATVQILALCGAGRTDEGLALAQRFLRAQPSSPFARRVRSACGFGGSSSEP